MKSGRIWLLISLLVMFLPGAMPVQATVNGVWLDDYGPLGEGDDYFTNVWGNPRDMDESYDLYILNSSCNPTSRAMWTDTAYENGVWRGKTSSTGEWRYLYVINPGWDSTLDVGEDGQLRKVDTSYYTQLSFRMRVESGAGSGRYDFILWSDGQIGTAQRGRQQFIVQADGQWHIYTFDLSKQSEWTTGDVSSLWIQLNNLNPGYWVEVDWIRLSPKQSYTVNWSGGSGTVDIYLGSSFADADSYSHLIVYEGATKVNIGADQGTFDVPASLPGGDYYFRVRDASGEHTTTEPLGIKSAPIAEILAPSYISGKDFATSVVGNPWDMDSTADVDTSWTDGDPAQTGLTYSVSDGVLDITNRDDGKGDCDRSWPHRPLALNLGGHSIDSDKYKYLTYRYKVDQAPDQGAGGVMRIRWVKTSIWAAGRTDDISLYNSGWNTYKLDLSKVNLEAETADWRNLAYNVFQVMVNESHRAWTMHLDWVKLTAENTASGSYTVRWSLKNTTGTPRTTIYWATAQDTSSVIMPGYEVPTNTTPVTTTLPYTNNLFLPIVLRNYNPAASGVESEFEYTVPTDGLTPGNYYYIAIELDDGYNDTWWFSELPVKIE